MQYKFKKPELRMIQSMRADVKENRHVYKCFFKALIKNGARFIWIDETSFNTRNLKYHSWVSPTDNVVLVPQVESSTTAICALEDSGVVYSLLKFGTNNDVDFLSFLIKLRAELKERHTDTYRDFLSKLVVVMDNCAIHLTDKIHNFFEKAGIVCITLPQYTPEFNPIEKYFRMVKNKVSTSN